MLLQFNSNEANLRDSWWRHQMETFSALQALYAGKSPVPVNSPHKGQWRGALMFSLICVWMNGWVNIREAGDLRRHRGHYNVNVMLIAATGLVVILKLDSSRRLISLCGIEMWWMTSKNYRAHLLYHTKLCPSFQSHRWIQTWVTVRKPSTRVKIGDFLSRVTLKFDG